MAESKGLAAVKVGDTVVEERGFRYGRGAELGLLTVERITAARIITKGGVLWRRDNGCAIPRGAGCRFIRPEARTDRATMKARRLREEASSHLYNLARDRSKLTDDDVAAVCAVLGPIAKRLHEVERAEERSERR